MPDVEILRPEERANQDQDRVTELILQFGNKGVLRGIGAAMQDLAGYLAEVETLFWRDEFNAASQQAKQLAQCADDMGFLCQGQIARSFSLCCARGDRVAASSTLARLVRLGESTLNSLCEQDLSG